MLREFGLSFVGIFVAMDIIGTIPMYLSMTQGMSIEARRRTVDTSIGVAFVTAVAFAFVGEAVFRHLGIKIFDFKIAGGIILLLVALADLANHPEAANRASGSTGIVPLAVPLITGPGVLTTVILQAGSMGYPVMLAALFANFVFAWALMRKSDTITRVIGNDGTVVVSKIAALLLAAIAVSMIRTGVFEAFRNFVGLGVGQ